MVPAQMVVAVALFETETGSDELTTIVIELDVAGFPAGQFTVEVSLQVITSPLAGL